MKRTFVAVTWTDAGDIDDEKIERARQVKAPIKMSYGWILEKTDRRIKLVTEETLPDDFWTHSMDATIIPIQLIKEIKVIGEIKE